MPYIPPPKAKPVEMRTTSKGDSVEYDKVYTLLDSQMSDVGFAYDTWSKQGWTRKELRTALDLLVDMSLITIPTRGQQTLLLVPPADALDRLEAL